MVAEVASRRSVREGLAQVEEVREARRDPVAQVGRVEVVRVDQLISAGLAGPETTVDLAVPAAQGDLAGLVTSAGRADLETSVVPVDPVVPVTTAGPVDLGDPVDLATSVARVGPATTVDPTDTTGAHGPPTRSAAGATPPGVADRRRGAGEHRRGPAGTDRCRPRVRSGTTGPSTTGAITRPRSGSPISTPGAFTSSESGSRCKRT